MKVNEKYIGESKMKDKPNMKLAFDINEGSVTTDKLKDGAVTPDKLEPGLWENIDSTNRETQEGLNRLQEWMNEFAGGLEITANTDSYEAGKSASVTITAKTKTGKKGDWVIRDSNNVTVYEKSDVSQITYTQTIDKDTYYSIICKQGDQIATGQWAIIAAFPTWLGAGNNYTDIKTDAYKRVVGKKVEGRYEVTVASGQRIYMLTPKEVIISKVTMGGFEVPMNDVEEVTLVISSYGNKVYKVYESSNTYQEGTYQVSVNVSDSEIVEHIEAIDKKIDNYPVADGEDIVAVTKTQPTEQQVLMLADKAYHPASFSGLGRKYLRKNIIPIEHEYRVFGGFVENVEVETHSATITSGSPLNVVFDRVKEVFLYEVGLSRTKKYYMSWSSEEVPMSNYTLTSEPLDMVFMYNGVPYKWNGENLLVDDEIQEDGLINLLTQDMINEPNTIYHIQYDYDLNGQTITIPDGCTLEFDGGKIYDSVGIANISCNNTLFKGNVLLEGVVIAGNILNEYIDVTWFGLSSSGDNVSKNDDILEHCMLPSCVNTGRRMDISHNIAISKPVSITAFDLWCEGRILYYGPDNLDGAVLTIGGRMRHHKVKISNVKNTGSFEDRKDFKIIGVDCRNINNSTIDIDYVWDFTTGVRISAGGGSVGCCYNTFNMNYIVNSYRNLVLYKDSQGWINENIINNGKYGITTDKIWYDKNTKRGRNTAISFINGNPSNNHGFNNIIFNKPCTEGANICIYANDAVQDSSINNIRNEGSGTLIVDESTNIGGYYNCVVIPYRYVASYSKLTYTTFTIDNKDIVGRFVKYDFDFRCLINDGIGYFSNLLFYSYNIPTNKILLYQSASVEKEQISISDEEGIEDSEIVKDGHIQLKSKSTNKPCFVFECTTDNIEGQILINTMSEVITSNSLYRAFVIFLDKDMHVLNRSQLEGIKHNSVFPLSVIATNTDYYYFGASADAKTRYFKFSNIPTIAKYMCVGITIKGGVIGASLYINKVLSLARKPSGAFCTAGHNVTDSFGLPDTGIQYIDTNNNMPYIFRYNSGAPTNTAIGKMSGTTADRPTDKLFLEDVGTEYYDTTLKKQIYFGLNTAYIQHLMNREAFETNTFATGKSYFIRVTAFREEDVANLKIVFAKSNTSIEDGIEIPLKSVSVEENASKSIADTDWFVAPDRSIYPYIYVKTTYTGYTFFNRYNKHWFYNGFTAAKTKGATEQRPTGMLDGGELEQTKPGYQTNSISHDIGFEYFDTTLKKLIYAKDINRNTGVVTWVDATGADV